MLKFMYLSGHYYENDCYVVVDDKLIQDVKIVTNVLDLEPSIICDFESSYFKPELMRELDWDIEFIGYDKDDVSPEVYNSLLRLAKHFDIQFNYKEL